MKYFNNYIVQINNNSMEKDVFFYAFGDLLSQISMYLFQYKKIYQNKNL
jgi:hypothetical protein